MVLVGTHSTNFLSNFNNKKQGDREHKRKVSRTLASELSRRFDSPYVEITNKEKMDGVFYYMFKELKLTELRSQRKQINKGITEDAITNSMPSLPRRSSMAGKYILVRISQNIEKKIDTSGMRGNVMPTVKRRMSGDELGRAIVLDKHWELYKKDIEEVEQMRKSNSSSSLSALEYVRITSDQKKLKFYCRTGDKGIRIEVTDPDNINRKVLQHASSSSSLSDSVFPTQNGETDSSSSEPSSEKVTAPWALPLTRNLGYTK